MGEHNMIMTLFILLTLFLEIISYYFFRKAFVRGETYDIMTTKLSSKSKLKKYLDEMQQTITWIENLPYEWLYMKSEDGLKLAGRLFTNTSSDKLVILFHGYRSIAENDFSAYFHFYYENHFQILLVDQRSHGKSEGKFITFGVKERNDCLKWCEYVEKNFSSIQKIYLAGMSMGATTVLLATQFQLPAKVKGIIADCGFTSPKEIITQIASSKYGIDVTLLLPLINILCLWKARFNIYGCSVKEAMQKNKLPILFIHGLSDDFVPSKMSKMNYNVCQSKKELVLVDCSNHGLSCVQDKEKIYDRLKIFLKV